MNRSRGIFTALLALLLSMLLIETALAADWKSEHASTLKQGAGTRRVAALVDLSGDRDPELAVVHFSGTTPQSLSVHSAGGARATVDLTPFALSSVKSVSLYQRRTSAKQGCLHLLLAAKSGGVTTYLTLGFVQPDGGELDRVYTAKRMVKRGRSKYALNGASVVASKYASAKRSYESKYKKLGKLPTSSILASDNSSVIQTKFNSLAKKYTAYANVKSIRLSRSSATLTAGKSLKLGFKYAPRTAAGDSIGWSTSDETIATVDASGNVKAVRAGTATITAKSQSGSAKRSCKITVKGPPATKVTLSDKVLTLNKGSQCEMSGAVSPAGANQKLAWTSSNTKVLTINKTTGLATALTRGKATITAATSNGKKASCKVVVNDGPAVIVDISQHNGTKIDWAKVAANVDLLILRCGVTRTETKPIGVGKDDLFPTYAKKCKEYGIPFGVYFYGKCSDAATAKKEAQLTWDYASPYKPLFYVYDVEETCLNKALIETYMKTLQSLGAKKTGYYIAHHLYSKYKLDTALVDFIWIPHYGSNNGQVDATPSFPCDIHQYTSKGRVLGFSGNVDVNRLMGTKSLSWFLG